MFQPIFARPLLRIEEEALASRANSSSKKDAQRAEVILLSSQGRTVAEISESLGFHPSNIKKWIRSFNEMGLEGIATKKTGPQGGPRPTFTRSQVAEIVNLSKTDPLSRGLEFKQWTPQKLAMYAVDQGIVDRISHVTVRQILKRDEEFLIKEDSQNLMNSMTQNAAKSPVDSKLQLGREALKHSEYEKAVEYLQSLLDTGKLPLEEEAIGRSMLNQALEELSRYEEAYQVIQKYEDPKLFSILTPLTRAQVKLRIGWTGSWLRNYPEAIAALNDSKKIFLELQNDSGICETHYALGRTYIEISEFRIARDHLLAAAGFEGKIYHPELMAQIYSRLGTVDYNEGAFSNAKENYLKALELAELTTNDNLKGMIFLNLGTAYDEGYEVEREESAKYKKRAIEYLEKGGHKNHLAAAYNNLGDNLRYSGLWDEAIESLNKAIEIAKKYSKQSYEATARITLAEILCSRGDFQEAESYLDRSLALIGDGADRWLESNALRVMAIVQRNTIGTDIALKTLREALRLSTSIGDLNGVALAQLALAEFHFFQGGYEQAREYLELAQGRLKEEKSLPVAGLIQRLTGQLEATVDRLPEARQHIAQSISIFTTTDIPFEIARSQYEMGKLLVAEQDIKGAVKYLSQAKAVFERLGAKPNFKLAEKALLSIDSGEVGERKITRAAPPSDVLLMQRLIEASASSELLVRELAAVIHDNFNVNGVMICKVSENEFVEPLAVQGIHQADVEKIIKTLEPRLLERSVNWNDAYVVKICEGVKSPIIIYIRTNDSLTITRLQPLLKQAELGLETCLLRAAARSVAPAYIEHRVKAIMPGFIIGSALMFNVIDKIQKIRTSNVTVLITGESGTGKELVARAVHAQSARARAIFLPFNCTATPKEIIDSHLFGHRRGSFTGATENYSGIIRAADGGTLFLDEIGDLSLEVQPKLMRFLQESEIQPLGEMRPIRVDVRVLAATNTDLERAVDDGRFRTDLFHRLNIIRIHVPPLRDRREEIPILAAHFLEHFTSRSGRQEIRFTQDALDALTAYYWPGNVRQLRNEIERVVAYASEGTNITAEDLSTEVSHPRKQTMKAVLQADAASVYTNGGVDKWNDYLKHNDSPNPEYSTNGKIKLKEATAKLERQIILASLDRNKNNLSRTALELGLSRRGLRLKVQQLGIDRSERD